MPRRAKPQLAGGHWSQRQKLVNEYIALDQEIDAIRPKLLRHEKLREIILDWYRHVPGEEEITVPGGTYDILVSSRDRLRVVTAEGKAKLYRLWGSKAFIAKAHMYLKALPDPKDEAGLYTVQTSIGSRHLRVASRGAAVAPIHSVA